MVYDKLPDITPDMARLELMRRNFQKVADFYAGRRDAYVAAYYKGDFDYNDGTDAVMQHLYDVYHAHAGIERLNINVPVLYDNADAWDLHMEDYAHAVGFLRGYNYKGARDLPIDAAVSIFSRFWTCYSACFDEHDAMATWREIRRADPERAPMEFWELGYALGYMEGLKKQEQDAKDLPCEH